MIKDIEQIRKKSTSFIKNFITNCYIEEKIDTHYFIIEITSKTNITIKKASGKQIDRVDMILSDMYGQLITDWNYIRLANEKLFAKYVGYNIAVFYFPNKKPLQTEYKDNIKYVIDRITYNNDEQDIDQFLNNLELKDMFHITKKIKLSKHLDNLNIDSLNNKNDINYTELFLSIIDNTQLLAKEKPEGYVLKWNNTLYQILFNEHIVLKSEKTQYEYVLCDFINYCKHNNYIAKITNNYVKTVTTLFNDYIINWEEKYHNIKNNVDINSIQPPTLGTVFDIGYEYIPDIITIKLCKNDLYKSIFKVLLANLRKGKDNKNCIYMNNNQVNQWNMIMKNIKIRSL